MQKKKYQKPELAIITFELKENISASGTNQGGGRPGRSIQDDPERALTQKIG